MCGHKLNLGPPGAKPEHLRSFLPSDLTRRYPGGIPEDVFGVEGEEYVEDTLGHGTKVLSTLFSIAPQAEFYIGKVELRNLVSAQFFSQVLESPEFPLDAVLNGLAWAFESERIRFQLVQQKMLCRTS